MIKNFKWLLFASLSISLIACSDDDTDNESIAEAPLTAGSADFSKYVALGNSLTAGFSDGTLFKAGQENAYPKLLADQFATVGGGEFKIPYMNDNIGGLLLGGNQLPGFGPRLIFNGVGPVPLPGAVPTTEIAVPLTGPFQNLGVPGAKSFHLLAPGYGDLAGLLSGTANPYFVRFRSSAATSILADAMVQQPTFFSLWIGNNDVLGYATTGGDGSNPITPSAGNPGAGFDATYNLLLETLTAQGAKGVVANIPYVTTIPHFTYISRTPLTASSLGGGNQAAGEAAIGQLNAQLYGPLKAALTAFGQGDRINLLTVAGGNPLLIKDETLTNLSAELTAAFTPSLGAPTAAFYGQIFGQARQTKTTDLILLATSSVIGTAPTGIPAPLDKYGITYPLQDKHILIPSEINEIKLATDAFNTTIKTLAAAKGLAFVDANALLTQLANGGIRFNNYTMNSTFVQGGAFGLDGIHITARANAYIANKFMEAINTTYGSTLRMYSPEAFPFSYPAALR